MNYTNDRAGRLTEVKGTPYAQNATGDYADNIQYRAFGQVKRMDYNMPTGDAEIKIDYDARLQVSHSSTTQAGSTTNFLLKADFGYLADGRIAIKDDLLDDKWDRNNRYDFAGRLSFNQFGMGEQTEGGFVRVYEQTVQYDGFSQLTSRQGLHWGEQIGFTQTYINGRIQGTDNAVWDQSGNIVATGHYSTSVNDWADTYFDASGRRVGSYTSERRNFGSQLNMIIQNKMEILFDGDGRPTVERSGNRVFHASELPNTGLVAVPRLFQMWSTVLGQSLTTIKPDGAKESTRVFAGEAIIASQGRHVTDGQTYETVGWKTADPVTGSGASFSFASYGNSITTGETEPFGQTVSPADPYYNPPDPGTSTESIGGAGDPEWQCQIPTYFYGGFTGMPFHCQKRVLQDLSRGLDEIYGFSNPHNPNSPRQIKYLYFTDSPIGLPGGRSGESSRNLAFAAALNTTAKAEDKKPKGVPEPNLPDGCEWVDGHLVCVVQSEPSVEPSIINMSDTGVVNASMSSDFGGQRLSRGQVAKIASDIQLIFDANPDCLKTIQGVLNEAQSPANPLVSTNPIDVLWAVFQQGGLHFVSTKAGEQPKGNAWGDISGSNRNTIPAAITLPPTKRWSGGWPGQNYSASFINDYNRQQELITASTVLAEVIHHSGAFGFDDREMGLATATYMKLPPPDYGWKTVQDVSKWSNWWHPKVENYCSTSKALNYERRSRR